MPVTGYVVEVCDEASNIYSTVPGPIRGNSVDVKDLIEGHRYKFRVSAVNPLGTSEPTETLLSVVAKNPFGGFDLTSFNSSVQHIYSIFVISTDRPDAPDSVKIDDYDRNSVYLSWRAPGRDGGNPIKGYIVEKRTPKGDWIKATAGLVPGTSASITGLEPGREVEFRVAAVNDGGVGEFSRATMPHTMKDKTCALSGRYLLSI